MNQRRASSLGEGLRVGARQVMKDISTEDEKAQQRFSEVFGRASLALWPIAIAFA